MRRVVLALGLALCFATAAFASTGPERLSNPALEARAVNLQRNLRCLVCAGESLDESGAPLAADLRRLIRARILAGDSDTQITHFLVSRYGNVILMKPPLEPGTYALWFGPLVILLLGGGLLAVIVLRARSRARGAS